MTTLDGLPIATLLLGPIREVLLAGGPIHNNLIVVTNEPEVVPDFACCGVGAFASAVGSSGWDAPYGTALRGKDVVWLPVDCTAAVELQHLEKIGKLARRVRTMGDRTWSAKQYQEAIRAQGRSALHAALSQAAQLQLSEGPARCDNATAAEDASSSPSVFDEALVVRVTTPTLQLALSIASALGVNAAAGGMLMGVRLSSRPVQIISSLPACAWATNWYEAGTAYDLDADHIAPNFTVETETSGRPLGQLRHDSGTISFDLNTLAGTIEPLRVVRRLHGLSHASMADSRWCRW